MRWSPTCVRHIGFSISNLDWMTPQTRQRALVKLDKFTAKVAYPKKWRDYSKLVIDRDDLYGNYQRGYTVNYDREWPSWAAPSTATNGS